MLSKKVSKAQEKVLELLLQGKAQKEIADILGLKESTIRFHTSNLFRIWGVEDKYNLVIAIAREGYFNPKPVKAPSLGLPQGRAQW